MTIKEIKLLILKRTEENDNEGKKSDLNNSFDMVNQVRTSKILNNSLDYLNIPKKENDFNTEKKVKREGKSIDKNRDRERDGDRDNSLNSDMNISTKKGTHKKVNLYYKEKELTNEEEKIGNLVSNNGSEEIELSMVILSLNDSTFVDENKIKEKLIQKIADKCQFHKDNKELFICISCGVAFCAHCSDKHKTHDIIERKNIIKFNNELKILNEELNKSLAESNLDNIYEMKDNNVQMTECNNNIEKLQNRLDNIKKMHKGIINNYKKDIDKTLPYLLEYKEKIEQLIESSYQLDTIKNEQQFMDYYYWFTNIKQKNIKIKQEIQNLQRKKQKFNELLENFDYKVKDIYSKIDEDYKTLKKYYYNQNSENENQFRNIGTDAISLKKFSTINNQSSTPKLNLFNLLNQNDGYKPIVKNKYSKDISKDMSKFSDISSNIDVKEETSSTNSWNTITNSPNINKKKINSRCNIFQRTNIRPRNRFYTQRISSKKIEEIEEKSEADESFEDSSLVYSNKIYNIKPKTKNIYYFDFETKKITEIYVNFDDLNIESFGHYHSTLNYKNSFYFSGGYNSNSIFCKYNQKENKFIKLKIMPTNHAYHGMLGMGNYIFMISGMNSKKVEKYDIINESWTSLSELNESRSWPSCLEYKNKYIFVFGGLSHKSDANEDNILIEKLDISTINNKWEQLNFNYNNNIKLPFYFGLVHINDNSFLLMGGKYNCKENSMNDCYKIIIDDKKLEIEKDDDFKLPKKEEFNGKMFANFGNDYYGEFSSFSHGTFYLVNSKKKTIEEIN